MDKPSSKLRMFPTLFLGELTHCRTVSRRDCPTIRPGHGLDRLNLSSNPEELLHHPYSQSPPSLITVDPRFTIRQPVPGTANPNRRRGLSAMQRMSQAQAIENCLRELGEDPEVIREVVAPLRKRRFDDI